MSDLAGAAVKANWIFWRGYCPCGYETSRWLLNAHGAWAELHLHRVGRNEVSR